MKYKEKVLKTIIKEVGDNPYITERKLAIILGKSERTIRRYIKVLKDSRKIELIKNSNNKFWHLL